MINLGNILLFCLICLIAGCGFTPRSSGEMPFNSIYIESRGFSFFGAELRRSLASNDNVSIVDVLGDSDLQLYVTDEVRNKKILSLSNAGNVREFELQYQVSYKVVGVGLTNPGVLQRIVVIRSLTYSDTKILAKEEEELLLFEEMQLDAVSQVLRRLGTLILDVPIRY